MNTRGGLVRRRGGKIDPAVAVEVMQEVIARSDTKRKRAFLGTFIVRVTMGVDTVTVEYRGEALLAAGSTPSVHRADRWLLDLGSNQGPTD